MDFFGGLTDFLDEVIPDESDLVGLWDTAMDRLSSPTNKSSAGSSIVKNSGANAADIYNSMDEEATGSAIGEAIEKVKAKKAPEQAVDAKEVQRQWMERLKVFAQTNQGMNINEALNKATGEDRKASDAVVSVGGNWPEKVKAQGLTEGQYRQMDNLMGGR